MTECRRDALVRHGRRKEDRRYGKTDKQDDTLEGTPKDARRQDFRDRRIKKAALTAVFLQSKSNYL